MLYDRHTPALFALARRQVGGDTSAAEDVVQEAWVRATERLGEFRGDGRLRSWLSGFVVRIAWEARRAFVTASDSAIDPGALAADDARLSGVVDRIALEQAIAALPDGFRQVLLLHDVEGFTHEEIGELLGIVPGTSKSQLSRARAALRRALHQGGNDDR